MNTLEQNEMMKNALEFIFFQAIDDDTTEDDIRAMHEQMRSQVQNTLSKIGEVQSKEYYSIISEERGALAVIATGEDFEERLKKALEQNFDAEIEGVYEDGEKDFCKNYFFKYRHPEDVENGEEGFREDEFTLVPVAIY